MDSEFYLQVLIKEGFYVVCHKDHSVMSLGYGSGSSYLLISSFLGSNLSPKLVNLTHAAVLCASSDIYTLILNQMRIEVLNHFILIQELSIILVIPNQVLMVMFIAMENMCNIFEYLCCCISVEFSDFLCFYFDCICLFLYDCDL